MGQPDLSERNFLYVRLCDNDYGWQLNTACSMLLKEYGYSNATKEHAWVLAIVTLVSALCVARDAELIAGKGHREAEAIHNSTLDYLSQHVSVSYLRNAPSTDDSGGSVVIDFNLRIIWNT